MTLNDILSEKGRAVFSISPDATLDQAVAVLVEHNVGALLVCHEECGEQRTVAGIISERDLLHAHAQGKIPFGKFHVRDVMTTTLFTGTPEDSVEQVMGVMTSRRIRHLPVLDGGRLVGMISIGDVVKAQIGRLSMENRFLQDYIRG